MRILILSHGDATSLEASYRRAFEALGHEVQTINPMISLERDPLWRNRTARRVLERPLLSRFNRTWLDEIAAVDADVTFVGKGTWALPSLWRRYRSARPGTRLVCYNADDPLTTFSRGANRPWITASVPCFDLFVTYKRALVEPLRRAGARRVARVPFAWDPAIHPMQTPADLPLDLVFVGNSDAHREAWLTAIVEHPLARDWRIKVIGRWHAVRSQRLAAVIDPVPRSGVKMAEAVAGARLSLNILRKQNEGSHNMRTFETPGCGGLMASQYSGEQDEFFPQRKAAVYFREPEQAAKIIAEALADEGHLSAMRREARRLAAAHTYRQRAEAVLAALEGVHA